jgi:hypothetical protein
MKNKIVFIIGVCLFVFGVSFADQEKKELEIPSLPNLINLEKKTVETYKAYRFTVNWIDGKPSVIDISQEIHNLRTRKVKVDEIVLVEPKSNSEILGGISVFKNLLTGLSISKVERSLSKNADDGEAGANLVRYDNYDSKGIVRSSEWRNGKNGTQVKYIVFSDNGKPLILHFYYKLKINQDFKPIVTSGKFLTLSLEQVVGKLGAFDYSNVDEVVEVCIKLLHQANELQGKGNQEED